MSPDIEKYRRHLDGYALSEADKEELIRALWLIMESFADRAFDLTAPATDINPKGAAVPHLVIEFHEQSRHRYGLADHSAKAPKLGAGKGKAS